jgi:signal transduction histidine kinase
MDPAVHDLVRFARLLTSAPSSSEARTLLVTTIAGLTNGAAVLVQLDPGGRPAVAAASGFDEANTVSLGGPDDDVAALLMSASGGRFASHAQLPLVADGGLYGFIVLLFEGAGALDDHALDVAGGLVDLTATMLARTKELDDLERAYAELSESRRALGQAEKLRAVGGMAAGIAHDLKNVFAPLLLQLDLMSSSKYSADEMRMRCAELKRPLQNGLAIVDRLRTFSKLGAGAGPELAELHTIVDDAVSLCRPRAAQCKHHVGIDVSCAPNTPIVRVEVAEVVAGVTNLIVNAIDAVSSSGGVVAVRTFASGDGACIEVKDDGPGIPDDVRARLFEPFFTTKGKEGTGLGLMMVKELAQRHGGQLVVDSAPGQGARFTLTFPRAVMA